MVAKRAKEIYEKHKHLKGSCAGCQNAVVTMNAGALTVVTQSSGKDRCPKTKLMHKGEHALSGALGREAEADKNLVLGSIWLTHQMPH